MSEIDLAAVDERLASIVRELDQHTRRLADARAQLPRSEQAWREQSQRDVATARDQADKARARARKEIEANAAEARDQARSIAERTLSRRAPRFLSAPWDDECWRRPPEAQPGEWVRVGATPSGMPIALPLSAGAWTITGSDAAAFKGIVHNVLARLFAAYDIPRVRVVAFDPGLELDLAAFASLRTVATASVPPAITSTDDFEAALERLLDELAEFDDRLTAAGEETYWTALAGGHRLSETPLRVLVVATPVPHLQDRHVARFDQLRRIAADRGLLILERLDAATGDNGLTLSVGGAARASVLADVQWHLDPWLGDRPVRMLCSALAARPRASRAPTVDFASIVENFADAWMADADEGLDAVLGIGDSDDFVVRLRSEDPPMPNALIGGAVGQGKSNLLLVLIHSLAARYSPGELEMVLVDLRDGVEFARMGPGPTDATWLPHVRALGLEFDPDYSIAVLKWVLEQQTERSRLLKSEGVATLKQYRRATGRTIPRLLVVIDEFQRLFEGDDDQVAQAAALLEGIARTGRGFGIHLVLASQAISGIRALATKRDAIFGQFHNRVTLKNTEAESQAFLTLHNRAAADLEHRGQAIANDDLGRLEANRLGTVAYADPAYLARLKMQLFSQGHGDAPSLFRASSYAAWSPGTATAPHGGGTPVATVGLPIGVDARPRALTMLDAPNQGLAVVGSDRGVALAVFARAVVTAARSLGQGALVAVLDGAGSGSSPQTWVAALVARLNADGCRVELVGREGIPAYLTGLATSDARPALVAAANLDGVPLGAPIGSPANPASAALRELLKSGPLDGTWFVGWWQSLAVLEEHLGNKAPGVRGWAMAGVSLTDLRSIGGMTVREPSCSPRATWFDRTGGVPERIVPFAADDLLGAVFDG